MGLAAWTKRLDDRVVGAAERDPAVRRKGELLARSTLVFFVLVLGIADYVGSSRTHLPVAVPWVVLGTLIGGASAAIWTKARHRDGNDG